MDHPVVEEIRQVVEASGAQGAATRITDLHVWRVGKNVYSCALSLVTQDATLTPARVRKCLEVHEEVVHATIEIHRQEEKTFTGKSGATSPLPSKYD
jgi:Co/Zn/Cd efflux system component